MMTKTIMNRLAFGVMFASFAGVSLASESYPERDITLIVPHGSGSSADVGARIIADRLSDKIGQNMVVTNQPGAGSTIGMNSALREDPDGYTIVLVAISNAINHSLQESTPFDVTTDVQGVSAGWSATNVAAVNPDVPADDIIEYIEMVRQGDKDYEYSSAGIGTSQHFSGEMLKILADIELEHVPYSVGTQSISDALGGSDHIVFNSAPGLQSHLESGGLKALGVTSNQRSPILPDIETFEEQGLEGFDVTAWWGFAASAEVPDEIVSYLSENIREVIQEDGVQEKFTNLGASAEGSTPEEYQEFIRSEVDKYEEIIDTANIPTS